MAPFPHMLVHMAGQPGKDRLTSSKMNSSSLDLQDRPTILACVPPSPTTYITDIYSYKGTKYDFYGFYAFFLPAGGLYAGYG
jgi:sensor domain CHASE-containing protein